MSENKLQKINVGDQVIARVENLTKVGFTVPKDYNFVNAIKASMLVLQELKDKNGKPALEVCTPASVASALFQMAVHGLDVSKKTAYFIVRGTQLCLHESYFGKALQVKRIYPDFEPHPVIVHEGDEFVYEIDPETGYRRLVKHTQSLENLDKDFVGGYMYIPTADGKKDLYIMSKKMIVTAWSKSSSREQITQRTFTEKMAAKTIVNSGCNMIINSTPDLAYAARENEDENPDTNLDIDDQQGFEEIQETAQIEPAPAPKPKKEKPVAETVAAPAPEPEPETAEEEDDAPEF